MTEPTAVRHLSSEYLKDYLDAGSRAVVVIAGQPVTHLLIDPPHQRIGLEVEWDGSDLPDLADYVHLATCVAFHDGQDWSQIWIEDARVLVDGYPMLCALADKIQEDGVPMAAAIPEVLASYRRILERPDRLSAQEEVGLMGELIVLDHLIRTLGEGPAVDGWLGADAEEHDFVVDEIDIEVKTTTGESRRHWIGSSTQLIPGPGRRLVLLSIQVTTGTEQDRTLGSQVASIREALGNGARAVFDAKLLKLGWLEIYAPQYRRHFRLRSVPLALAVDEGFPAITVGRLAAAGLPVERFLRVSYELDISGLPSPHPLPAFLVGLAAASS